MKEEIKLTLIGLFAWTVDFLANHPHVTAALTILSILGWIAWQIHLGSHSIQPLL
jgi:hypothetical protein